MITANFVVLAGTTKVPLVFRQKYAHKSKGEETIQRHARNDTFIPVEDGRVFLPYHAILRIEWEEDNG